MIGAAFLLVVQDVPVLERWRESIELDLPAEVVEVALPLVSGTGTLAQDGEAIALAARALSAVGEEAGAAQLLQDARPGEASAGWVEVARARLAIERDELARAQEILLPAQRPAGESQPTVRWPKLPECWLLAGRALARAGEGQRADPFLERYLALAPLDAEAPMAWHMRAQIAVGRGDETAAGALRQSGQSSAKWQAFHKTRRLQVREKPDEPLPRLGLCELYLAAGDFNRAREAAAELTTRAPEFCRGWLALAQAERGLSDVARARAHCEKAIACDEKLLRAQLELARILLQQGERQAGDERYTRYRALGGDEPLAPR